jgi:hypothetical protein
MLQIMQHPRSVTTNGHLTNRQVIRQSHPQFSISLALALRRLNIWGEASVRSGPEHVRYRHLDLSFDEHDSLIQLRWCRGRPTYIRVDGHRGR